jgi:hypothetical protein
MCLRQLQVSDEGGGIPRSHMHRIWSYLFTTADPAIQRVRLSPPCSPSLSLPLYPVLCRPQIPPKPQPFLLCVENRASWT